MTSRPYREGVKDFVTTVLRFQYKKRDDGGVEVQNCPKLC